MKEEELVKILVNWFYQTDLILDEAPNGLDNFHDKSIVVEEAKKLAKAINL